MLPRSISPAACLVAGFVAITAVACSGSPGSSPSASVTCTSYPLHGAGPYHAEVQVKVSISNNTSGPANYLADVVLAGAGSAAGSDSDILVTVSGLVPASSSGTLSRKVLTAQKARHCEIRRLSRS
jgi:hypothetical protein